MERRLVGVLRVVLSAWAAAATDSGLLSLSLLEAAAAWRRQRLAAAVLRDWRELTVRRTLLRSALQSRAVRLRLRSLQTAMLSWMLYVDSAKKQGRRAGVQARLLSWSGPAAAFEAWSSLTAARRLEARALSVLSAAA